MLDKNNRKYWVDEDWDNLSSFRRIHRKITGIALTDSMIGFYCTIFVALILINIFVN